MESGRARESLEACGRRSRLLFILCSLLSTTFGKGADPDPESFFELKIRPVLLGSCFKCHGGQKVTSDLRVDSREALLRGGQSGPAVIPGDAERSLLIQAVRHTHEKIKLSDEAILNLTEWVDW